MMEHFNGQVFVYGSLRSGFHHPAYEYISRYFRLVSDAKVKGSLYDMGEYPAAVPTEKDQFIIGELYRINNPEEFEWAIAQLDDYEGLNVEHGDTPLYRREQTIVYANEGQTSAWIYWFNGDTAGKTHIESGDTLEYMKNKS
ncbi:MAG: gamma-glutamylcyclotransferase family protein [Bacteroidota bacterium]